MTKSQIVDLLKNACQRSQNGMKDGTFPENALIFVDVTRDSITIVGVDRADDSAKNSYIFSVCKSANKDNKWIDDTEMMNRSAMKHAEKQNSESVEP